MDWTILGIAPTKDKKAITAAYRARLKLTNPEEKPEEFKALRAAYEEAIRLADQEDQPRERDESPVGLWKERLAALYEDFSARLEPENWKKLLGDDICVGLDTRPLAEEALLGFLLENYFLPRNVWQVLDEVFSFSQRAEELCEEYPREFVENAILNGIRLDPALPYDLFTPGVNAADCDAYRRLYHQTGQTPLDALGGILDRMEALSESHPYGRALRCRWLMDQNRREEATAGFRALAREYPHDEVLNLDWAAVCMEMKDLVEAEATARHILEAKPDHIHAKRILADCLAAKGEYDDAKELAFEIMHTAGDDPIIMDQCAKLVRQWNETMIGLREATFEKDPADWDNAIELAWCYTQNERLEDALRIAEGVDVDCSDQFAYHNLMGKLYHNLRRCADALPHLAEAERLIREMTPDGTAKTAKRMARLPEMIQVQGNCLMQIGREAEARVKFEQALELAPEDPKVLTIMGQILFASGDYEGCVSIQEQLLRVSPGSWFANVILSLALQKLHRDREAFDAVNRAMSFQGGDLSLYVIKMQILLRNGVFDEVHAILDFLRDNGAPQDLSTDWITAQLTELEQKNEKKAFREYQALARRVEQGEDMMDTASLYYRMAVLMGKQMDDNKKEDREILMTVLEKGLAQDKYHEDCLGYKAWLLQKDGKLEQAVGMYRSLRTPSAQLKLAELYYGDLSRYAAEALACYEELLRQRQSAELYFYAATCKRHMGDLEGAMDCYRRELELDPMDVDGYNGVAYILEARGRYEEALAQIAKAIDVMWETENYFQWLIEHQAQILRRMGRHQEALAALDDALGRQNDPALWQLKFDTCVQFGLYDQAKTVLDRWQQAHRGDPNQAVAAGRLHLLMGKMLKSTLAMGKVKHKISFDQEQNFRLQLADLECNHKRKIQLLSRQCIPGPGDSDTLAALALAQWWAGDRDAVRNAQRALDMIDEILTGNLVDEALYRSRRSVLLAILGRAEEAKAELAAVRKLPLCQFCAYGSCKDADIYEAYIEEILGNHAQARKLFAAGRKNWPDELDFVSGENRMKKKGK